MSGASLFDSVSVASRTSADGGSFGVDNSGWTVATGNARAEATSSRGAGAAGFDFGPLALGLVALAALALALRPRG